MTMQLISTITVGAGGASSIEFTNIPQDGTDLLLLVSTRSSAADSVGFLKFNGNSSNYSTRFLFGTGSSVASASDTIIYYAMNESGYTANTFANNSIYIPNYAGATNKSVSIDGVNENNATATRQFLTAATWANTSAITSIELTSAGGNLVQHSTASLYKVTKA